MATSRATPRAALSSCLFYDSSSSTPGSKGPKPKWQQLSGLNLVKSLQVTNGENYDNVEIDLSSNDESTNNGGSWASPQYNPTDPESSEDPAVGLELSFNSSMYSLEDPASLTDQSSSQSISTSTPATKSRIGARKVVLDLQQSLLNLGLEIASQKLLDLTVLQTCYITRTI